MAVTAAELKEKFNLTDKRAKFVIEYFNQDFNAAQAAVTAGYSKKTCRSSAYQLLTNIDIQKALAYAREQMMASLEISEDHILKRL
ncbi:MAG: terminase small subunit, partial [bacterium]|nr:terminase small subunit [bacterium]